MTEYMATFKSTKLFDGFSTCFRQWKANGTHCKYLHGYGVSFRLEFEGDLDERNWVWDFGGMKRATTQIEGKSPKEWMDYMFDHTTIVAKDDPLMHLFLQADLAGLIKLRVIEATGAEKFAEFLYNKINTFVQEETQGRVCVSKVEFYEHSKNSAIYLPKK